MACVTEYNTSFEISNKNDLIPTVVQGLYTSSKSKFHDIVMTFKDRFQNFKGPHNPLEMSNAGDRNTWWNQKIEEGIVTQSNFMTFYGFLRTYGPR